MKDASSATSTRAMSVLLASHPLRASASSITFLRARDQPRADPPRAAMRPSSGRRSATTDSVPWRGLAVAVDQPEHAVDRRGRGAAPGCLRSLTTSTCSRRSRARRADRQQALAPHHRQRVAAVVHHAAASRRHASGCRRELGRLGHLEHALRSAARTATPPISKVSRRSSTCRAGVCVTAPPPRARCRSGAAARAARSASRVSDRARVHRARPSTSTWPRAVHRHAVDRLAVAAPPRARSRPSTRPCGARRSSAVSAPSKISSARRAASPTAERICSSEAAMVSTSSRPSPTTRLDSRMPCATSLVSDSISWISFGDLLGAAARALGELADLVGHHREAAARLARARRLDRGVQRQQVRAVRDARDHLGDLVHVARLRLELEDARRPTISTRSKTVRIFSIASRDTSTPEPAFWFASAAKPNASRARAALRSIADAISCTSRVASEQQLLLLGDVAREARRPRSRSRRPPDARALRGVSSRDERSTRAPRSPARPRPARAGCSAMRSDAAGDVPGLVREARRRSIGAERGADRRGRSCSVACAEARERVRRASATGRSRARRRRRAPRRAAPTAPRRRRLRASSAGRPATAALTISAPSTNLCVSATLTQGRIGVRRRPLDALGGREIPSRIRRLAASGRRDLAAKCRSRPAGARRAARARPGRARSRGTPSRRASARGATARRAHREEEFVVVAAR